MIPGLANKPIRAFLLDGRRPLKFASADNSVTISVPAAAPDKTASVIALDIQGAPTGDAPETHRRHTGDTP